MKNLKQRVTIFLLAFCCMILLPNEYCWAKCASPKSESFKKWSDADVIFLGAPREEVSIDLTDTSKIDPPDAYPLRFAIMDLIKQGAEFTYTDESIYEVEVNFVSNWKCIEKCDQPKLFDKTKQYLILGRVINGKIYVHPLTMDEITPSDEHKQLILSFKRFSDLKDGDIVEEYYPSRKLRLKGLLKNGQLDGMVETYYEDGILQSRYTYKDGHITGEGKLFYPSGQLRWIHTCREGKSCSPNMIYWKNGKPQKGIMFDQDCKQIGIVEFDQEGKEVKRKLF